MKQIIVSFIAGILLTVGCMPSVPNVTPTTTLFPSSTPKPTRTLSPSRTPTASLTPWPTLTPSLTSTPQPTLIAHEWSPEPILISFEDQGGLCDQPCPPLPLPFILYGDGTLVVSRFFEVNGEYRHQYLYKKLPQNEICRLLNTIDQNGYFDFDPESYSVEGVYDALQWDVRVHAWKNKDVSLYASGELVDDLKYFSQLFSDSVIPPSILNTFILLDNYPLDGFSLYPPNPLAIWIWKSSGRDESRDWTVPNVSLAELYQKAGSPVSELPKPVMLKGQDAVDIYAMFDNSVYFGLVTEGNETYYVYVRPVLPFEQIVDGVSVISPKADQLELPVTLQCIPADGVMAIPVFESK